MSWEATTWAWELKGLTPTQKLVLIGLANYANADNICYPGQKLIGQHAGVSERTVRTVVKQLEEAGVLKRERRYSGDGFRTSDRYILKVGMDLPADFAGSAYRKSDAAYRKSETGLPEIGSDLTGSGLPGNSKRTVRGNSKKNTQLSAREIEAAFDAAYSAWPKKVERKKSFDKFKQVCRKRDPDELVADIRKFADAYVRAGTEKQFVPALVVWLNGERWTDELPQPRGGGSRVQEGMSVADELRAMEGRYAG